MKRAFPSMRAVRHAGSPARHPRVSVVVPTLNEAANLPHVFERMPDDVHEIVVVDGFSTDDTPTVARGLDDRVRVVEQSRRGKGNALAHGFAAARGDIIVSLDADCSADPGEIPRFVDALVAGADFAKGSRYLTNGGGGGSADITRLRDSGNRTLTAMVNALFGTAYTDLCYGYNAFWRHCVRVMGVDSDGFEVETLMNIRVARAGMAICEVPSYELPRLYGASNLRTFRDGMRVQRTILHELVGRRRPPIVDGTDDRRRHARGEPLAPAVERRACFVHLPFAAAA
jgi:glycosyltransferase involved in cell wall biosynthesis